MIIIIIDDIDIQQWRVELISGEEQINGRPFRHSVTHHRYSSFLEWGELTYLATIIIIFWCTGPISYRPGYFCALYFVGVFLSNFSK